MLIVAYKQFRKLYSWLYMDYLSKDAFLRKNGQYYNFLPITINSIDAVSPNLYSYPYGKIIISFSNKINIYWKNKSEKT